MRCAAILCLILALSGCDGPVAASGPRPFPSIPATGATISLAPGTYSCPAALPSGTHIHGLGAVIPPEFLSDPFAPISAPGAPVGVVRILCNSDLKLSSVTDLDLSGVILDFNGTGGLILENVTYSRFDMGIVNSTVGLTLESRAGNSMGNVFPRLVIYKTGTGVLLQGFNSKAVTWNDFGHLDVVRARDMGIDISQFADTNTFHAVRIRLDASAAAGVVFNDNNVLSDVDASGNTFGALGCDADNAADYTGYCADFRGYTVGNNVTMGFGIMPDANKIHFANAFSQGSNVVVKLQEHPKQ